MKIRPLHDWAVIRRLDAGEKTTGGIIIPVVAREKPAEGIVEAIGPGKYSARGKGMKEKFVPTTVRPGQRVVFADFAARDTEVDGQQVTFVREEDILGTHEGDRHPDLKASHAVSVREEMPLLVPGKPSGRSAAAEEPKNRAAGRSTASGKKGTAQKVMKKSTKPAARKESKPVKTAVKKDRKAGKKKKTTTGKSAIKSAKKTAKKTVRGKGRKTAQGKAVVKKTEGKKKSIPKKTLTKKKTKVPRISRSKK